MPELDFDKLGGLIPDEEGYLRDPGHYTIGKLQDGKINWWDIANSENKDSKKLIVDPGEILSIERGREPHTYVVRYPDGRVTYRGFKHKPDVPIIQPQRTNAAMTDIEAILRFALNDDLDRLAFTDYLTGNRYIDLAMLGIQRKNGSETIVPDRDPWEYHPYYVPISEARVDVRRFIEDRSSEIWEKPYSPKFTDIDEYLLRLSRENIRNPFLEDIKEHYPLEANWKESAAFGFFGRIGMTAPALDGDDEALYVDWVCRAYLLATIERQQGFRKVDMALCVYGNEGTGKSSTFEFLGGRNYRLTSESIRNPQKFMESVVGGAVVEFNDSDQQQTHPEAFKGFIDHKFMQYRKPYDRVPKEYPVPFVTVITSNDHCPIVNVDGARRIFPLCLDGPRPGYPDQIPYKLSEECRHRVWGAAWRYFVTNECREGLWKEGYDEIKPLAEKMQNFASKENPNENVLRDVLSLYKKISRDELKKELVARLWDEKEAERLVNFARRNPSRYGMEWKRINVDGDRPYGFYRIDR